MLPPGALIVGIAQSARARCQVLRDKIHSVKKLNEVVNNICISTGKPAGPRVHFQNRYTLLVVYRDQGRIVRHKFAEVISDISRDSSHVPTKTILGKLTKHISQAPLCKTCGRLQISNA